MSRNLDASSGMPAPHTSYHTPPRPTPSRPTTAPHCHRARRWALAEGAKAAAGLIKAAVVEGIKAEGRRATRLIGQGGKEEGRGGRKGGK